MEKLEERFSNLAIAKRSVPEEPSYLLHIDCLESSARQACPLVAASCSDHCVHLYDRLTLTPLRLFRGHAAPVSGVRFSPGHGRLFSASLDGTVRCWDVRSQSPAAAQTYRGFSPPSLSPSPSSSSSSSPGGDGGGHAFLCFDLNCDGRVLCAGTEKEGEDAFLVFWDPRGGEGKPLGVYSESHSDDVTQVRFHPELPDRLASGSTDGLVNVFDLSQDVEGQALLATCNSESSVSFVGWSGEEGGGGGAQIYCTTHDEGFCLWDLTHLETEDPLELVRTPDARETTRADGTRAPPLDYLIGGFCHRQAGRLLVLAGTHLGGLHFLSHEAGNDRLSHVHSPRDSHAATIRAFHWDPEDNSLVSGGEDGQLLLWKAGAEEAGPPRKGGAKVRSSVQKRVRVHGGAVYKK